MPIRVSKNRVHMDGLPLNLAAEVSVASAATTNIGAALSNNVRITGTTTITSLGTANAGITRTVRFAGALTLTHNATSLILPAGINVTTAANDTAEFLSLGSGNWICRAYNPVSGLPTLNLPEVLTIGPGNRFANLSAAIRYIIDSNVQPTQIYAGLGGTVAAIIGSDKLTFTGLAEGFNPSPGNNGGPSTYPIVEPMWIDINNEGKLRLIDSVVYDSTSSNQLVMATGWNLPDASGMSYKLYRLPSYIIPIPSGSHVINSDVSHDMSVIRANVSYIGESKLTSQINFSSTVAGQETAMGFPHAGLVAVKNIHSMCHTAGNRPWGADESFETNIGEQMFGLAVSMENMIIEDAQGDTLKDMIGLLAARILVRDVHVRSHGHNSVFAADSLVVDGLFMESTYSADGGGISVIGHAWYQKTKKQVLSNIRYFNAVGSSPIRIGSQGDVNASAGTKEVFVDGIRSGDITISDTNTGKTIVSATNLRCDTLTISGASLYVTGETHSIKGQADISIISSGILTNLTAHGSVTAVVSANATTPNANVATIHYVTVAAALTINAPTNPSNGQVLILSYYATAAITIAYNAIFKKSTVPVSSNGTYATHTFVYNGTYWVEQGGPMVWL